MDTRQVQDFVDELWSSSIVPSLVDYVRIPNKSPRFDPQWAEHGHMERAVELVADWCKVRPIRGLELEVVRLEGRTPVIFMEIPGELEGTVLLYGHLDKQPEMEGWEEGLGPWEPVIRGEKLYGRGGADDGYSAFASLTAIEALQRQGIPHARCVVLIEACEESGSEDLPFYVEALRERIGSPDMVICLDSGAGNYEQLWLTTSLRGNLVGNLKVEIIEEGVHSGDASGVVPSSFRIARELLGRLEDSATGELIPELSVEIPDVRRKQAAAAAEVLGEEVHGRFPFVGEAGPPTRDLGELVLNRTWRPWIEVTGADGLPPAGNAGNVLRPYTSLKLSLRLPPTLDGEAALEKVREVLTTDPPYGARVTFEGAEAASGWHAPPLAEWLEESVQRASQTFYGRDAMQMGEGGTIPFMGMLGEAFPEAQFLITGVLGPKSNAHGPNEFLHIPYAQKLTACVSQVILDHGLQRAKLAPV